MRLQLFGVCLLFVFFSHAQESIEFTGSIESQSFGFSEELPFWMFTNSNRFLSRESNVGVSAFAKAAYTITPSHTINVGLGAFLRDGVSTNLQRSDLFLEYRNRFFTITGGAKNPEIIKYNLSTINGNILLTGNARALPGVLLSTTQPIRVGKYLDITAELAHYRLNDNRLVSNVNVHYKYLKLGWTFKNKSSLSVGLRHYVQWGGTTVDGLSLQSDFNAFAKVFIGASGGDSSNPNEFINALGNHLGTYEINYKIEKENASFEAYHHTLFEDRSGRELNNFPDGVWGLYVKFKRKTWIKGLLYEYVQTISQSGGVTPTTTQFGQQSGADNYFRNSIYRSGWTYEGETIGLPFIRPLNTPGRPLSNRSIAHHLGFYGGFKKWRVTTKLTYLENLGAFNAPLEVREKQFLSYVEGVYSTRSLGQFTLYLGADFLNTIDNNMAAGIGYRYTLE